jgi:hypothetical protein
LVHLQGFWGGKWDILKKKNVGMKVEKEKEYVLTSLRSRWLLISIEGLGGMDGSARTGANSRCEIALRSSLELNNGQLTKGWIDEF